MSKIGRNDPCPCGSGKKFKNCCSKKYNDIPYMLEHIEEYPVSKCFVNKGWEKMGMAFISVLRTIPESNDFFYGNYCCDTFCLGVKDTFCRIGKFDFELEVAQQRGLNLIGINYEKAREIVLGSVEYARSIDFEPHQDWEKTKHIVEWEKPYKTTIKFGKDGEPFYIQGPNDDYESIIQKLKKQGFNDFLLVDDDDDDDDYEDDEYNYFVGGGDKHNRMSEKKLADMTKNAKKYFAEEDDEDGEDEEDNIIEVYNYDVNDMDDDDINK